MRPRYFTPNEVTYHNTIDDLWVTFLGKVYNLTPLYEMFKGKKFLRSNNTSICFISSNFIKNDTLSCFLFTSILAYPKCSFMSLW